MARFDLTQPQETEQSGWTPLQTGEYLMEIAEAGIELNTRYPNRETGKPEEQLKIVWELAEWSPAFEAAGYQQRQRVYWRMKPSLKAQSNGQPSKFRAFVDALVREGLLAPQFDEAELAGIRRYVLVEQYTKTEGDNAGQPGNRVLTIAHHKGSGPAPAGTPTDPARHIARPAPTATHAMTRQGAPAVNVAQADQIDNTELKDLREEVEWLAQQAGSFWARKDFRGLDIEQLKDQKAKVERFLKAKNPDPNEELFAEA